MHFITYTHTSKRGHKKRRPHRTRVRATNNPSIEQKQHTVGHCCLLAFRSIFVNLIANQKIKFIFANIVYGHSLLCHCLFRVHFFRTSSNTIVHKLMFPCARPRRRSPAQLIAPYTGPFRSNLTNKRKHTRPQSRCINNRNYVELV